ncbi:MAG TPA: hypothetical protein VF596_18765 [Pyrinomonadaceae bacterium]|jgi:hypothetical protein
MSETALAVTNNGHSAAIAVPVSVYESLALRGDISGLSPNDKAMYYRSLCERLGLDPLTQPFTPLKLSGKEILYASRGATDQLARINHVNRRIVKEENLNGCYVVTVEASLPSGRTEQSKGAVSIENLKGEAFCNAVMKAETKAKRRATLAILGLGMLDETELETIPRNAMQPQNFGFAQPVQNSLPVVTEQKQPSPEDAALYDSIEDREYTPAEDTAARENIAAIYAELGKAGLVKQTSADTAVANAGKLSGRQLQLALAKTERFRKNKRLDLIRKGLNNLSANAEEEAAYLQIFSLSLETLPDATEEQIEAILHDMRGCKAI